MNILHKLGLYTKSEIDELIKSTVNLLGSVDCVIEEAKIHRACYKAAIGMVNDVNHAVRVVSDRCDTTDCTECDFNDQVCEYADQCKYFCHGKCECGGNCKYKKSRKCKFAFVPPYDWRIER